MVMADSLFMELFNNKSTVTLIDFFLDNKGESYTKKELEEMTGLSKVSVIENWKTLEEFGLLKVTRQIGRVKLYKLDTQNKIVKALLRLEMALIEATSPKEKKKVGALAR